MKKCTRCGLEKNSTDFYRRSKAHDGLTAKCKSCAWVVTKASRQKNESNYLQKLYAWRKSNPERLAELQRACHEKNKEKHKPARDVWAKKNRDKVNSGIYKWKLANAHLVNSYQARRRSVKKNATPSWANDFFIKEIYELAKRRTKATGIEWHVDHLVPLQSPLVRGLHVESNLAVIPAKQNSSKGNKYWMDMP